MRLYYVCLLFGCAGYGVSLFTAEDDAKAPETHSSNLLKARKDDLSFRRTNDGNRFKQPIVLQNHGDCWIEMDLETSCGCASVQKHASIAPFAQNVLNVYFDPSKLVFATDEDHLIVSVEVSGKSNVAGRHSWPITGSIFSAYRVKTPGGKGVLKFVRAIESNTIPMVVDAQGGLRLREVRVNPRILDVDDHWSVDDDSVISVPARLAPGVPDGRHTATLDLLFASPSGVVKEEKHFVEVEVQGEFISSPSVLKLQSGREIVTVSSRLARDFRIDDLKSSVEDVTFVTPPSEWRSSHQLVIYLKKQQHRELTVVGTICGIAKDTNGSPVGTVNIPFVIQRDIEK